MIFIVAFACAKPCKCKSATNLHCPIFLFSLMHEVSHLMNVSLISLEQVNICVCAVSSIPSFMATICAISLVKQKLKIILQEFNYCICIQ